MSTYRRADGRTEVQPDDGLTAKSLRKIKRQRPCGCDPDRICNQHWQVMSAQQRAAAKRRGVQPPEGT